LEAAAPPGQRGHGHRRRGARVVRGHHPRRLGGRRGSNDQSQPVLLHAPRTACTAYTMPPYILNMCMSQLPMKLSNPTPMPVSTSAKMACDFRTGVPEPEPLLQLAPALHENDPPPFSRRLHELAVLQTPAGNSLKYLSIQASICMAVFCIAAGTGVSQWMDVSLMMIAPVSDAKFDPLTL